MDKEIEDIKRYIYLNTILLSDIDREYEEMIDELFDDELFDDEN